MKPKQQNSLHSDKEVDKIGFLDLSDEDKKKVIEFATRYAIREQQKELLSAGVLRDFLNRRQQIRSSYYSWDSIDIEKKIEILADVAEHLIDLLLRSLIDA